MGLVINYGEGGGVQNGKLAGPKLMLPHALHAALPHGELSRRIKAFRSRK